MGDEGYEESKKGLFFLIAVALILVMIVGLVWIFSAYTSVKLTTSDILYYTVYESRFLSSPDCFAYSDFNTGNVYVGTIDIAKFTSDRLNSCYKQSQGSGYEFLLTLNYEGQQKEIYTQNYGASANEQASMYVLVFDGTKITKGELLIDREVGTP